MMWHLSCVMTLLKQSGKANVQHKDVITEADMEKLYTSKTLDIATAQGLQYIVFIDIMFYTCRGCRENLRKMSKADFQLKHDIQGRRYYQDVAKYETKKTTGVMILWMRILIRQECMKKQVNDLFLMFFLKNCLLTCSRPEYSWKKPTRWTVSKQSINQFIWFKTRFNMYNVHKGNDKITELRTILQRESQNS